MSYLSQMVAPVLHNFVSAATGIVLAAALVRGIARQSAKTLGNFWVDLDAQGKAVLTNGVAVMFDVPWHGGAAT